MATEAVLILIDCGLEHAGSVAGVDARNVFLGDADQGRNGKYANLFGAVRIVAVNAGGVAVVVQQRVFGGVERGAHQRLQRRRQRHARTGFRVAPDHRDDRRHHLSVRVLMARQRLQRILGGIEWRAHQCGEYRRQ